MTPVRCSTSLLAAAMLLLASVACVADPSAAEPASGAPTAAAAQPQDIKHLEPAPDSVGPQPTRFAWSKVDAADSYTFRIWTEFDVRVVSESLTVTSVDFPKDIDMPAGTYFWSIVAMRGDQPIAESGLAAFVVQKP